MDRTRRVYMQSHMFPNSDQRDSFGLGPTVQFGQAAAVVILGTVREFVTDERRLRSSGPSAEPTPAPTWGGGSERWRTSSPIRVSGRKTHPVSRFARSTASTRMTERTST